MLVPQTLCAGSGSVVPEASRGDGASSATLAIGLGLGLGGSFVCCCLAYCFFKEARGSSYVWSAKVRVHASPDVHPSPVHPSPDVHYIPHPTFIAPAFPPPDQPLPGTLPGTLSVSSVCSNPGLGPSAAHSSLSGHHNVQATTPSAPPLTDTLPASPVRSQLPLIRPQLSHCSDHRSPHCSAPSRAPRHSPVSFPPLSKACQWPLRGSAPHLARSWKRQLEISICHSFWARGGSERFILASGEASQVCCQEA